MFIQIDRPSNEIVNVWVRERERESNQMVISALILNLKRNLKVSWNAAWHVASHMWFFCSVCMRFYDTDYWLWFIYLFSACIIYLCKMDEMKKFAIGVLFRVFFTSLQHVSACNIFPKKKGIRRRIRISYARACIVISFVAQFLPSYLCAVLQAESKRVLNT